LDIVKFLKGIFPQKRVKTPDANGGFDREGLDKSLDAFMNRRKYNTINSSILSEISDDQLIQSIVDYISDEIIRDNYKDQYLLVKALPIGFQHIFGVFLLEAEVNNGGFNQFFYNSSSLFIDEAHNGCIAIGATKTARVVATAVDIIMKEMEMQKKTREIGTIEAFMQSYEDTKLGVCDDEFYKYPEDLQGLCVSYIRNNYKDFEEKTSA